MRVGLIIGRFQVKELHEGHKLLLRHAKKNNDRLLVMLGSSRCGPNRRELSDFKTRQLMINEFDHHATVVHLSDMSNDQDWSNQITSQVYSLYPDHTGVTLYGGRDSCLDHYIGPFKKEFVTDIALGSGTAQREEEARYAGLSAEFRHGCIYTVYHQRPAPIMAVDIAILKTIDGKKKLLLGRKEREVKWRFPGGKVDVTDEGLEHCGVREAMEETGILINPEDMKYVFSHLVNDWRYRDNPDQKIMTTLYVAHLKNDQEGMAGDDLKEVRWFDLDEIGIEDIGSAHKPLMAKLKWYLGAQNV